MRNTSIFLHLHKAFSIVSELWDHRETIYRNLIKSGFIFLPVMHFAAYKLLMSAAYLFNKDAELTFWGHIVVFLAAIALCLLLGIYNAFLYKFRRKRCFSTLRSYFTEENYTKRRAAAMFPPVDPKYLHKEITGIVAGSVDTLTGKKYVCLDPHDPDQANHILVNGISKAGKSTGPVITSVLSYFLHLKPDTPTSEKISWVVVDAKPEIARKCTHGEPDVHILNPADRNAWGWDLYAAISEDSTDDEVDDCISSIIEILIPLDPKNEFFVDSARSLLKGGLFYEYRINHLNFINSLRKMMLEDCDEYVGRIKQDKRTPKKALMLLAEYGVKYKPDGTKKTDESNAAQDIKKQVRQKTDPLTRDDLAFFFDDTINKKMCNAAMVNDGASIFLSIKRNHLSKYQVPFLMILYQIQQVLADRDDYDDNLPPCVMILDEFHNLGKGAAGQIPQFTDNIGFIRSKKVVFLTVIQQKAKLEDVYGKADARTIINSSIPFVLSMEDTELAKEYSTRVDKFEEEKVTSYKRTGLFFKTRSSEETVSYVNEDILRVMKDFNSLITRQEAFTIIDGQYFRFDKFRYYMDKSLRDQAKYNEQWHDKFDLDEGGLS